VLAAAIAGEPQIGEIPQSNFYYRMAEGGIEPKPPPGNLAVHPIAISAQEAKIVSCRP
jgi:hypothetical protein